MIELFNPAIRAGSTWKYPVGIAAIISAMCACAKRIPEPAALSPGTPHISWVLMSGDRGNPDREFACQSDPRSDCVLPVSRPDRRVFSDVHFYYHGAGAATNYTGTIQIRFFDGSAETHKFPVKITVRKEESIINQSIMDIVTSQPGTYAMTFDLTATSTETGKSQAIQDQVSVVVR